MSDMNNANNYSSFVESLKRLYDSLRVSNEQIKGFLDDEKITTEEYLYVLGKDGEG